MNAPDKIYIFQDGDDFWYKPEEWKTPPPHRVEYLRKDALLEWIDEKQNNLDLHEEYEAGRYDVLEELIDKLNSL